jgi:hypothetical protein
MKYPLIIEDMQMFEYSKVSFAIIYLANVIWPLFEGSVRLFSNSHVILYVICMI